MKFCELRFALLFSFYLYEVSGFYVGPLPFGKGGIHNTTQHTYPINGIPAEKNQKVVLSVKDPAVVNLGSFALHELNRGKKGSDGHFSLLQIVKADSQSAPGNLTKLTLKVTRGKAKSVCVVKILNQPLLKKLQLVYSKCATVPDKGKHFRPTGPIKPFKPKGHVTPFKPTGPIKPFKPIGPVKPFNPIRPSTEDELDVNQEEVIRLSKMAVKEINKGIVNAYDRNYLLEIVKASARMVSGQIMNLKLTLKISQVYMKKMCEVKMQKHIWTRESRVMEIKCLETDEDIVKVPSQSGVFKVPNKNIRGAVINKDTKDLKVNDTAVVSMANSSLVELNKQKKEKDSPLTLKEIIKVVHHKQTGKHTLTLKVSQGNTENTCVFDLLEISKTKKFDIVHSKCGTVPATNKTTNKRDEALDGNDPEDLRLSVLTVIDLNRHNKGKDEIGLLEIIKVFRQKGLNASTSLILKVSQGHDKKICYIKVIENHKSGTPRVIESLCQPIIINGQNNGGDSDSQKQEEDLDVKDPQVVRFSTLAMITLNKAKSEEDHPLILLDTIKALYTSAEKSMSLKFRVSQGKRKHVCKMRFWLLPHTKKIRIKYSKCGTVSARTIVQGSSASPKLMGGVTRIDVNDPKVIRLTMVGMVELYNKYSSNNPIKLLKIVKATKQIVAGELTTLTLQVSQGMHTKMCYVKILEQAWLDLTKVIESECKPYRESDYSKSIFSDNGWDQFIPE